jgi:CheY-like chemotaxis protein/two-component sensor histidine kinase
VRKQYEEKEKLEGQLKLAAKLEVVGRLAGGIAHDFNNLLTVINGCAQLLEEEIATDPAHATALAAEIQRAGGQAAALTRQLLTFSRQRTVTPHALDLNAVVTEAAQVLVRLMGEKVKIRVVTEPNLPLAMAEASLLAQILLNLAVNARDAMPDGGTLTFSTSLAEPGWVRLTAADTGVGMTDDVKSHIFEPFFTTKDVGKGTGLGLSTVYGIVQTLGGKIRFHSELGRGTTFEVDLPTAGAAVNLAPTAPLTPLRLPPPPNPSEVPTDVASSENTVETLSPLVATPIPAREGPAVVFLVEDDESVRSLVRHVLEHAGMTVLSATGSEEALTALAEHTGPLDLLITDVVMPGIGGRELADRVRESRPGLPVLFMSGYTPDEVLMQGVREDQVDFLHKPFAPQELTQLVRRMLGQPV